MTNSRELLPGVTIVSLEDPSALHDAVAGALGEPKVNTARIQACKDAIEQIVDAHGLTNTLVILADVCGDKAGHIMDNWQDPVLARQWSAATRRLHAIAQQPTFRKISVF